MFQFIKRLFGCKPKQIDSPELIHIKEAFAKFGPFQEDDVYIPGIGCFTVNDSNREEFNKWFREYLITKGHKLENDPK